ncbi:MAG: hypothetical protein H8E26_14240 [FCB group bacterium]|nr:hypothetical protein [FCB group bacterium]MBL7027444.1 hypothetical protein [Candidatus Neomarinimicrobiota bacterium]MBL7122057.1 hypothetical protein [Candidatus Neomarinimicrobiota bacterium]
MAKIKEMEEESQQARSKIMPRFHHIAENATPDPIRTDVVKFVRENYTTEQILARVPKSVTDAFLPDYLSASNQIMLRLHGGDNSDVVILEEVPA